LHTNKQIIELASETKALLLTRYLCKSVMLDQTKYTHNTISLLVVNVYNLLPCNQLNLSKDSQLTR